MRRRRMKKSSLVAIAVVFVIIISALVAGSIALKTVEASYEMRIDGLESQIEANLHDFYVAAVDIGYGDVITEDMLVCENQLITNTSELFTKDCIGMVAKVPIPAGTIMLNPMCAAEQKEATEREVEYTCFYVSKNIKVGDYIDVRIRYANGEDFVVFSKKRVERLSLTNATCFLMVSEEEMQMMASAIVDVSEFGAVLYSNVYPQPEVQAAAAVTYLPRTEIQEHLELIALASGKEYNDISAYRESLEARLLGDKEAGKGIYDISNLMGYEVRDVSNTNGNGAGITSDYEYVEEEPEVENQIQTEEIEP